MFVRVFGLGEHHNSEQSMLLFDVTNSHSVAHLVPICGICVTKLVKNVSVRLGVIHLVRAQNFPKN